SSDLAVLAIGARIARVGGLRDLVVARLRIRAVHDAEPAAVLIEPRAEAAEERDREGRDDEPRLLAALVPEAPGAGLAGRRSASRDPGAHRVGVDACDAGAVVAGGSWIFLRDREDRLDALRKGEDDAVRGRKIGRASCRERG